MTEKNDFTIDNPIMYDKENGRCRCIPIPYEKYMAEKRFVKDYCCGDTGLVDNEKEEWFVENINSISDLKRNWNDVLDKLNEVAEENRELKHNNKMLSMKMSEVYTKYCLLKEFSEDTNPNDAVKRVLSELMQITKEYR